jgi:hypothetical protein
MRLSNSQNFNIKDLSEASYAIGIKICRDKSQRTSELSQNASIEKVLERFRMTNSALLVAPNVKEENFNQNQCP